MALSETDTDKNQCSFDNENSTAILNNCTKHASYSTMESYEITTAKISCTNGSEYYFQNKNSDHIEIATNEQDNTNETEKVPFPHNSINDECTVSMIIEINSTHEIKTETVRCTNGTEFKKDSEYFEIPMTEKTEFTEDITSTEIICSTHSNSKSNATHKRQVETIKCSNGTQYEKITVNVKTNNSSTIETTEENLVDEACSMNTSIRTNETHKTTTKTIKCSNGTQYEIVRVKKLTNESSYIETTEENSIDELTNESPTIEPTENNLSVATCSIYISTIANDTHETRTETTICANGTEYEKIHIENINR